MILLAYFHGEGILFSFLIHVFFGVLGGSALLYGLVKYKSLVGATIAIVYVAVTLIVTSLSQANLWLESVGWALTLPWNAVVPCYNLDRSCTLSLTVSLICSGLNAAILYNLIVWFSRPK
jgi:hypothetical protein